MTEARVSIARLDSKSPDFDRLLEKLLAWDMSEDSAVADTVRDIIRQVREKGDDALLALTRQFDRLDCANMSETVLNTAR